MRSQYGILSGFFGVIVTLIGCGTSAFAGNAIDVYLSGPGSITSPFSNITTETFNSLSTGTRTTSFVSAIGTYTLDSTTKFAIVNDDQYGTGTSKYMAFGAQSGTSKPIALTFTAPQSYFGFSWNAGDRNNGISFYNGNTLIGRYSTAAVLDKLSGSTVTAIDGSVYQSTSYFGKPGTGQNAGEPYAFLHFIDTNGMFDKVVFDNSGTTGTGFESDNHTIRTAAPAPLGTFVYAGSSSLPEPGTLALLGIGLTGGVFLRRRK